MLGVAKCDTKGFRVRGRASDRSVMRLDPGFGPELLDRDRTFVANQLLEQHLLPVRSWRDCEEGEEQEEPRKREKGRVLWTLVGV